MATVVNKTTFEVIESVNTPDYDPSEWLLQLAVASGNTARINYVAQLASWIDEGQTILYGVQDLIDSLTTEAEVDSIEMDLQSWLSSDPQVVIRTAKGIE